jgi:hypothetical protein
MAKSGTTIKADSRGPQHVEGYPRCVREFNRLFYCLFICAFIIVLLNEQHFQWFRL